MNIKLPGVWLADGINISDGQLLDITQSKLLCQHLLILNHHHHETTL